MNEQELREMIRTEIAAIVLEDKGDMDNDGKDEPDDEEYMDNKDKAIKKAMKNENEDKFDNTKIPAVVDRFMKKFISALKDAKLNRRKKVAVLGRTISALGLTPQEIMKYTRIVKKDM